MHTQDLWSKLAHTPEKTHAHTTYPDLPHLFVKSFRWNAETFRHQVATTPSVSVSFLFGLWPLSSPLYLLQPTRGREPLLAVPACIAPDSSCRSQWPMHHTLFAFKPSAAAQKICPASSHRTRKTAPILDKEFLHSPLIMNILVVINSLFILCFTIPFG